MSHTIDVFFQDEPFYLHSPWIPAKSASANEDDSKGGQCRMSSVEMHLLFGGFFVILQSVVILLLASLMPLTKAKLSLCLECVSCCSQMSGISWLQV